MIDQKKLDTKWSSARNNVNIPRPVHFSLFVHLILAFPFHRSVTWQKSCVRILWFLIHSKPVIRSSYDGEFGQRSLHTAQTVCALYTYSHSQPRHCGHQIISVWPSGGLIGGPTCPIGVAVVWSDVPISSIENISNPVSSVSSGATVSPQTGRQSRVWLSAVSTEGSESVRLPSFCPPSVERMRACVCIASSATVVTL